MPQTLRSIFKSFHKIPTGIKLIVFVIFLRSLGWGFVDPYWSIYLNQFHENYSVVGLLTAVFSFSSLLAIIPMMRLADKMKEAVVIGDSEVLYFFVIIGYVLAGMFQSLPLLILSLFFNGIAQTLLVIGIESYIRKHDGAGKSGPFGYYVALDYLGWIIGMVLAAFLIQFYTVNTMFLIILPAIFFSLLILPHIHERGVRSIFKGLQKYFHSRRDLLQIVTDYKCLNPKMNFFFIISFFDGAIRMFTLIFIPLFALSIDLSLRQIALLMAVMYFPFILSYVFSELSDRMRKMNVIATGLFIGGISFVLLYFIVHKGWIVLLTAAISLSMAIVRPAYNGAITRLAPRRMFGEVTSLNNFSERLGRIVGPILAGVVADSYGLQTTFLMIAVIAFGLGALSLFLRGYDLIIESEDSTVCVE